MRVRERAACVFEIDACKNVLAKSSHDFFLFWGDGGGGGPFVSPDLSPEEGQRGARGDWTGTYLGDVAEVRAGWGGFGLRFQSRGPSVPPGAREVGRGLGRRRPGDRGDPSRSLRHRVLPVGGARTPCLSQHGSCGAGSPAQDRGAGSLQMRGAAGQGP